MRDVSGAVGVERGVRERVEHDESGAQSNRRLSVLVDGVQGSFVRGRVGNCGGGGGVGGSGGVRCWMCGEG